MRLRLHISLTSLIWHCLYKKRTVRNFTCTEIKLKKVHPLIAANCRNGHHLDFQHHLLSKHNECSFLEQSPLAMTNCYVLCSGY